LSDRSSRPLPRREARYNDGPMFELTIQTTFNATHALVMYDGQPEPTHGHDWHVTAIVAAPKLDSHAMVMDFHELQSALRLITEPLHHTDLNAHPVIAKPNPSAERVAQYIAEQLISELPADVSLQSVSVTEAPGCIATYRPS
jgi:6-pyruvoyltetrahydropterin/6-carboxytetrahydropterin synthase